MLKKRFITLVSILFIFSTAAPSHALWWMFFHKPEFKGKVIDAETKEPIEGAVVVIIYNKTAIRLAPESSTIIIDVKETLTDKEGNFSIPSYTTVIDPLAWENLTTFIIFKPGYGSFPDGRVYPIKGTEVHFEEYFSTNFGIEKEVWWREPWKVGAELKKIKVTFGIVELPPLKTREEREKGVSIPNLPLEFPCYKIKNLVRLLREEYITLGYSSYKKWKEDCNHEKD